MIRKFFDEIPVLPRGVMPTASQMTSIGASMVALAQAISQHGHRAAQDGEELVYVLHETVDGPSLYLVSDAAGVRSAPHEHQTWAVIAGVSGNELNVLYEPVDADARTVRPVSVAEVKAGDVICLHPDAIHATYAMDDEPTYHLHLYGRPLRALPPFASRCYTEI